MAATQPPEPNEHRHNQEDRRFRHSRTSSAKGLSVATIIACNQPKLTTISCNPELAVSSEERPLLLEQAGEGGELSGARDHRPLSAVLEVGPPSQRRQLPTAHQPNRHPRRPPGNPPGSVTSTLQRGVISILLLQSKVGKGVFWKITVRLYPTIHQSSLR
jgi:hypothetical protein